MSRLASLPRVPAKDPPRASLIPPSDLDASHLSEGHLHLRYDDVTQDGHLRTVAMSHAIGRAFWAPVAKRLLGGLHGQGVVPILSRMCMAAGDGPIGLEAGVRGEAVHTLAWASRTETVERILLCVWVTLFAPRGRVYGPPPAGAGEMLTVGRIYAENVFTRPFAPPGERRVLALDAPGLPRIPERRVPLATADEVLELPEGGKWTSAWERDPAPVVFGVDHTDSNQHVNSLVYPQIFRDAALRAWARAEHDTAVRVVFDDLVFRKPCFAGQQLGTAIRTYARGEVLGAVVALVHDTSTGRPAGKLVHSAAHIEARKLPIEGRGQTK